MSADDVTVLLAQIRDGAPDATERLLHVVYAELRRMAGAKMNAESPAHTLQPTVLVHDAFLKLVGSYKAPQDRGHFFGAAARAMERILVDHARRRNALKRGGNNDRVTLQDIHGHTDHAGLDVLDLHEAVNALERESPDLATLVRNRYFIGLSLEQIADIEQSSLSTIRRRWTFAKAWLYDRLAADTPNTTGPAQ